MPEKPPQSSPKPDRRAAREARIAEAAYALLEEKGFAGTSMLAIARRARASNETLYNWYGDKTGLFKALILRNSADLRAMLDAAPDGTPAIETLRAMGPLLLRLLLGDRAIALNRAAAADATGTLGQALAAAGRDTVLPRITALIARAGAEADLGFETVEGAAETYIRLLVGDQQIRRAIGALPEPGETEIEAHAAKAFTQFSALFAPSTA
ncbi:MAG: TetR/AcrR family transcriptional regulator [Pseudomonadota bacterium]